MTLIQLTGTVRLRGFAEYFYRLCVHTWLVQMSHVDQRGSERVIFLSITIFPFMAYYQVGASRVAVDIIQAVLFLHKKNTAINMD